MNQIQADFDLSPHNTFRVSVKAEEFLRLSEIGILPKEKPFLVLGEGANVLFTKNFQGLVVKNELQGRKIISQDEKEMTIEVASGESWIGFVNWSVEKGWSGIENLAFIPGTIGAAVVGNIAAYGGNIEDIVEGVDAVEFSTGKYRQFTKEEMKFGYRESVFSQELKGKYLLTSVTFKLSKKAKNDTRYHSRYESLISYLPNHPDFPYTPKEIAEAVTKIRQDKLPDWRKLGTAGSFFKNPIVKKEKAFALQNEIADLQIYPAEKLIYSDQTTGDLVKLPAGRLLDELGWKGKKIGRVGTWINHSLTVVNYGGATGQEILDFTRMMQADIKLHYSIDLEPEVNII